jgi:peptide/nickel transport system permease protein
VTDRVLEAGAAATRPEPLPFRRAGTLRRLLRQPVAVTAGAILVVVFVVGAIFPRIAPTGSQTIRLSERWINHPPMWSGWSFLGTDHLGRDVVTQTLYALHTSEQSALLATLIASLLGIALGGIAGYRGGWADALIMRFGDAFGILPAIVLLLVAYTYFFPVTVAKATIILALYLWIPVARVVRAEFASLREREFVQAALSLGASSPRIFFRHLLPNCSSTIIVAATSLLGQVIVLEATLDFFQIGIPSGVQVTLGNLIAEAQSGALTVGAGWWTLVTPAALLILILVCVNLFGDGLADAMRPTGRR